MLTCIDNWDNDDRCNGARSSGAVDGQLYWKFGSASPDRLKLQISLPVAGADRRSLLAPDTANWELGGGQ